MYLPFSNQPHFLPQPVSSMSSLTSLSSFDLQHQNLMSFSTHDCPLSPLNTWPSSLSSQHMTVLSLLSTHDRCCCCCCRPHSTNVLPAESSTRNHVAASSLSPQVARKGSTLSGFVQRSRLEREVGRDLHSNKWEEV